MKVLHIINNLGSGGAEKLLEDLIPTMSWIGDIEIDILLLTDEGNVFYDSLIKKGTKIDVIKYKRIYDPRNILQIKNYINEGNYDIIHSHLFPTQYWVALSRLFIKSKSIKFITTEHSTHNRRRKKLYLRPVDKWIYSKYDAIISITEKTKKNLIKWIDPKRMNINKHIVIENGIDLQEIKDSLPYNKSDLLEDISEDTKIICMIGRFSDAKDQPTLIKAISKLGSDVHLVLVGEGILINDNKQLANKLEISDRVHFLGFRQDIPRILKTVDIVVLSSYWEGLSLASLEGLASTKPFIASRVPGLEEVVNGYGLLFTQGDFNELSDIINRVLTDEEFSKFISERCLKRAESYDISNTVKRTIELYKGKLLYEKI